VRQSFLLFSPRLLVKWSILFDNLRTWDFCQTFPAPDSRDSRFSIKCSSFQGYVRTEWENVRQRITCDPRLCQQSKFETRKEKGRSNSDSQTLPSVKHLLKTLKEKENRLIGKMLIKTAKPWVLVVASISKKNPWNFESDWRMGVLADLRLQ